ncbi:hypothetical protein D3X11_05630 [Streptococcus sp. X16XC17]|uniref:hypothetical protein n=1 Tax=unclassified Streptococcus TaxID=2608887 RepID=UPI00066FD78E|nr:MULTISPECIES: hypothetical protein [unclassified Streptococcus]TCD45703.1 hypothetical protein D3X11_05630 [Streptococcus sp. X16XC17]
MKQQKQLRPLIDASLVSMTHIEKSIAHQFLTHYPTNFSAEYFTKEIHVSQASLNRFAKIC